MVNTGTGANNIFSIVEHIILEDIQNIVHGYFSLKVIGDVNQMIPNHLTVSALTKLAVGNVI